MTRALLSIVLLPCALLLGCSAEPPPPDVQPAQAEPAAVEPQTQGTPVFTDDFEEGKVESWTEGEGEATPVAGGEAKPADTN